MKTEVILFGPGISTALRKLAELHENFEYGENIAHSRPNVGEDADYKILWKKYPTPEETLALVKHLDEVFADSGCKYAVTSETKGGGDILAQIETSKGEDVALTFVRLIGPSISQAIELLNKNIAKFPGIKAITGELIGRYDYAFEWLRIPDVNDIISLSEMMDRTLAETGVIYNIATKSKLKTIHLPPKDVEKEMERQLDLIKFVRAGRIL
ncbi:MAG: hypothetical protein ACFE95_04925 [Candidatus Hodarchaeota archaeon]